MAGFGPEATLLTGAWRSDTDVTGSPLRTVKIEFLRVRARKVSGSGIFTDADYGWVTQQVKAIADRHRQGPNRLRPRRRLRALRPRPQRRAHIRALAGLNA